MESEALREKIRGQALGSTYVMAGILGFHDIIPSLHLQMCNWISAPPKRKLGLVPRDHLKTSVWTIADSIRRICKDPNIRILIGNETATNASHFLRRIEAVFERNALFQWLFPEVIPDFSKVKKWSENEMLIPRDMDYPESTIETIGVGGAVVSRHYKLIKLDDLVGKEASESAEVMQKTIDWYQYCESLLERPDDEIHAYGTRWAYNDLYAWIEKNEPDVDVFFRSAYDSNGEAIWPERFSGTALERIRRKMGSFKFSCQYLNQPYDPEAASFHESWLRFYAFHGGGTILPEAGGPIQIEHLYRTMRVDPAISDRSSAARSAIVVDGVAADGRIFLLEAWAQRGQPMGMIEKIFELQERWDCVQIGFESIAYQRILKPILEAEAERRGIWLNVIEMKPDSRQSKESRIRGVQPYFERGLIWVRKDQEDFLDEYRQFPVGKTVDVLDAFAYGPHMWTSVDPKEEEVEEGEALQDFETGRSPVTGY